MTSNNNEHKRLEEKEKTVNNKLKNSVSILLMIALCILSISGSFAAENDTHMTKEEAISYLENYRSVCMNANGEEVVTYYSISDDETKEGLADYIVENGLDAFLHEIDTARLEIEGNDQIAGRSVTPLTAYRTISGNGRHTVSAEGYGYTTFGNTGAAVEYVTSLSYKVNVSNGAMTGITNISFDIEGLPSYVTASRFSYPQYCNSNRCGVTANFRLTRTIATDINGLPIDLVSQVETESFALLTTLN